MFRLVLLLIITITLFISSESLSQTCCWRNIGSEILFPYDKDSKVYNDMGCLGIGCGWNEVFVSYQHGGDPYLKCPKIDIIELDPVKPSPFPPKLDYKFSGKYTVAGDGSAPRGYSVTLSVDLIDLAHGTTVKSAKSTWTCAPSREAGYCMRVRMQETIKLAKTFQPLDKLIYDYERIPEKLKVELEKDPVLAGEKMKITLRNIVDVNSRPSQPWQRILVKAEKGKILNGESLEDFKVFRVGDGIIEIEYQAPDICKNDVETLIVMNSCSIRPDLPAYPEKEIMRKQFNIFCVEGKISFSAKPWYNVILTTLQTVGCGYSGKEVYNIPSILTFRLKPSKDPCYYEVVQKEGTPLKYKFVFTPKDMEHCAKMTQTFEENFRLRNASVNFKNNPTKPFYFELETQLKATTVFEGLGAPPVVITNEDPGSVDFGSQWPLIDGYQDDYFIINFISRLQIDQEAVKGLRDRCFREIKK